MTIIDDVEAKAVTLDAEAAAFAVATTDDDAAVDVKKDGPPPTPGVESDLDLLAKGSHDEALVRKMALVNNALDEIGFTSYHLKLFFLNGWGYGADSMVLLVQSVIATPAYTEFGSEGFKKALTIAVYVGMLAGAIFWGFSADIIGRRLAFNVTLLLASIATIIAGAMPNWPALATMVAIIGFSAGGNLILDTAIFLEYLPHKHQYMVTLMALFWGIGQAIVAIAALGFLVPDKWNCSEDCTMSNNMGWRYVAFTCGAIMFVGSILRLTVVRLQETPKFLLGENRDDDVIETLNYFASRANRPFSLTADQLKACGEVRSSHGRKKFSFGEVAIHLKGLFEHWRLGLSTLLLWLSWAGIGLIYPLFYVFLPDYVKTRGTAGDSLPAYDSWKNYVITNVVSVGGPILGAWMCNLPLLGRKWTMVLGALSGMACLFAYAADTNVNIDTTLSALSGFFINVYYGTLYAYTPEVLPSAHRATGDGVSVGINRIMGILSAIIGTYADTSTPVPVYICAALFGFLAIVSALFPYEPYGRRSS
ncbi:hypothetical protein HK405_004739 [Cladochytrium tenue]|nr:hypothetical protein HK405_004739 [Cladochytrium tenue]